MIIAFGLIIIAPTFVQPAQRNDGLKIMLSFSVVESRNVSGWCRDISNTLKSTGIKATVFFTGKVAEHHPDGVSVFGDDVDIGSQTYSYVDLASIADYSLQLEEVRKGKQAVDNAGKLYSRLFRAPHGSTDENIYSLLTESDIIADFSYEHQYNVFHNGQFIWFNSTTYNGIEHSAGFVTALPKTAEPVILTFDSTMPSTQIREVILKLKTDRIKFVSASEITGLKLTVRR